MNLKHQILSVYCSNPHITHTSDEFKTSNFKIKRSFPHITHTSDEFKTSIFKIKRSNPHITYDSDEFKTSIFNHQLLISTHHLRFR